MPRTASAPGQQCTPWAHDPSVWVDASNHSPSPNHSPLHICRAVAQTHHRYTKTTGQAIIRRHRTNGNATTGWCVQLEPKGTLYNRTVRATTKRHLQSTEQQHATTIDTATTISKNRMINSELRIRRAVHSANITQFNLRPRYHNPRERDAIEPTGTLRQDGAYN